MCMYFVYIHIYIVVYTFRIACLCIYMYIYIKFFGSVILPGRPEARVPRATAGSQLGSALQQVALHCMAGSDDSRSSGRMP